MAEERGDLRLMLLIVFQHFHVICELPDSTQQRPNGICLFLYIGFFLRETSQVITSFVFAYLDNALFWTIETARISLLFW